MREQYKAQVIELSSAGFTEEQINRLILRSSNTIIAVINNHQFLLQAPYLLTHMQIIKIAAHDGGSKNIEAVKNAFAELTTLKFSPEQIVRIARNIGGSKNIGAVKSTFAELTTLKFSPEQIVRIAGHDGGSKNIGAVTAIPADTLMLKKFIA